MNEQHLRLSDAERDQAAAALGEHYAQGRLSVDEHGERLDRIWAARTRGELVPVFRDLPGGTAAYAAPPGPRLASPSRGPWARGRVPQLTRGLPTPLLVVLVALVVLTVLTHLPLVLLGLLAWFFVVSRHRRGHDVRRRRMGMGS